MLKVWKDNLTIVYNQLKSTANFLGSVALKHAGSEENKALIEQVLAKINGMEIAMNTSMDQADTLAAGAKGELLAWSPYSSDMEKSLQEFSQYLEESIRKTVSFAENANQSARLTSSAYTREMGLNRNLVSLQTELSAMRNEKIDLEKKLEECEAKLLELSEELAQKESSFASKLRAAEDQYQQNVELLETSLRRNKDVSSVHHPFRPSQEADVARKDVGEFDGLRRELERLQEQLSAHGEEKQVLVEKVADLEGQVLTSYENIKALKVGSSLAPGLVCRS